MTTSHSVKVIGLAGGSGSGKTTFARLLQSALASRMGVDQSGVLAQDSYYIDQSAIFRGDGENVNFDHPDSLDFPLMAEHLAQLKLRQKIQVPIYDFASHTRKRETTEFGARSVIIVDGTLILTQPKIVELLDWSIFIQTSEAVRFDRRFRRDLVERGRQPEGIRKQFERQVKPMHDQFVEPSSLKATEILSGERRFDADIERWASRIQSA